MHAAGLLPLHGSSTIAAQFGPPPVSDFTMRLSDYLRSDFVLVGLEANDVESVVHAVAECAEQADLGDSTRVLEKLLERERAHPTVIGEGLAIPHATVPGLSEVVIGIALPTDPIVYGAPDADPVRAFFVLLSPPGSERLHVKLLARICRLVRHGDLIPLLEKAESGAEVVTIIQSEDDLHP